MVLNLKTVPREEDPNIDTKRNRVYMTFISSLLKGRGIGNVSTDTGSIR
jgi:hypothetical protein